MFTIPLQSLTTSPKGDGPISVVFGAKAKGDVHISLFLASRPSAATLYNCLCQKAKGNGPTYLSLGQKPTATALHIIVFGKKPRAMALSTYLSLAESQGRRPYMIVFGTKARGTALIADVLRRRAAKEQTIHCIWQNSSELLLLLLDGSGP